MMTDGGGMIEGSRILGLMVDMRADMIAASMIGYVVTVPVS